MCGRAKLETDVSEIKIAFRIPPEYPTPNFAPSWSVAPTDNLIGLTPFGTRMVVGFSAPARSAQPEARSRRV
jgi:hypothetical protein